MGKVLHFPRRPPAGISDEDARGLGVDPPAFLKGLVAPRIFVKLRIGLCARYARQRNEREAVIVPAPASAAVLLLPLL